MCKEVESNQFRGNGIYLFSKAIEYKSNKLYPASDHQEQIRTAFSFTINNKNIKKYITQLFIDIESKAVQGCYAYQREINEVYAVIALDTSPEVFYGQEFKE